MPRYKPAPEPQSQFFDVILLLKNREAFVFHVCSYHVRQLVDVETVKAWDAHRNGSLAEPVEWLVIPPAYPLRSEADDCSLCHDLAAGERQPLPLVRTPVKVYPASP